MQLVCMVFFIYWDIKDLVNEGEISDDVADDEDTLQNIALTLGDALLLRHLLMKFLALATRDVNVSLLLETHVHLHPHDSGHGHGDAAGHTVRHSDEEQPLLPAADGFSPTVTAQPGRDIGSEPHNYHQVV